MNRWDRRQWVIIVLLLAAIVTMGWLTRHSAMTLTDEATYLAMSQSLEEGRYREEFLVGAPPHIQYPPGIPAWFLLLRRVAGPSHDAVRLANILAIALASLLLGDALRRLGHAGLGIGAMAVVGLNQSLLNAGGMLFSEPLYILLSMLAVWASLVADQHKGRAPGAVAAVAAVAGAMTRLVGVAVVAGIGAWTLLRRRWGLAAALSFLAAASLGGWLLYVRQNSAAAVAASYGKDLARESSSLVGRLTENLVNYGVQGLPTILAIPTIGGTPLDNILWLLFLLVCGGAGGVVLLRRWPAAALTLLGSAAILLVWPWPLRRLLQPLIPIIISAFVLGSEALGRRLRLKHPSVLPWGFLVLLLLSAGVGHLSRFGPIRACHAGDPLRAGCFPAVERGILSAALFARDSTSASAVLVTGKPASTTFYSGRRTVPLEVVLQGSDPLAPLRTSPSYLILSRLLPIERGEPMRLLRARCRELTVRSRFEPSTLLLELRDTLSTLPDACAAMAGAAADSIPDWTSPW